MEESYKNKVTEDANDPAHYKLITIGIIIGMIGILLRFTGTWTFIDAVSNIRIVICLKAVLRILK